MDIFVAVFSSPYIPSSFIDDIAIGTEPSPTLAIIDFTPKANRVGTVVSVNGSGFLDVTEVLFDDATASFAVQSDSVMSVTVPAQASTNVITVKTAYSTAISSEPFTVLQPLTVNSTGNGRGTVTSSPAGITCGDECSQDYDDGTQVTLSAQPANDSVFEGWSGACTGDTLDCIVSMTEAKNVTATFNLKTFALSVNRVGNGTVTSNPAGISCGTNCTESYVIDTEIELTAQPASDSVFVGWGGACSGTNETCEVTIDAAKDVTATFALKTFSLNVTKNGSGNGTVMSEPSGISCGADCTKDYDIGTSVTLVAEPDEESVFTGWGGDCTGTQSICEITISDITSVNAEFATQEVSEGTRILLPLITP